MTKGIKQVAVLLAALAAAASPARADRLIIAGIPYAQVRLTGVGNCRIIFNMPSGKSLSKSLLRVTMVDVTDLPLLGEAEQLMASGRAAEAVAVYGKAEKAEIPPGKSWLKLLLAHRKLAAAKKAGVIFEATAAWLAVMDANNASVTAINLRPAAPAAKSAANDRAIELLKSKENSPNKAYAAAASRLQIKLLNLQGRTKEAGRLAAKLVTGSAGTDGIKNKLATSASYIKAGEADKAVGILQPLIRRCNRQDLPRVMLLLGKAQLILAGKAEGSRKHKLLCEAGLNFVRVAAFFGGAREEASEALYYAGQVNQSLAKPNIRAARAAYKEVIERYRTTPAGAKATKALAALKGK
jgi:hypothetical protein